MEMSALQSVSKFYADMMLLLTHGFGKLFIGQSEDILKRETHRSALLGQILHCRLELLFVATEKALVAGVIFWHSRICRTREAVAVEMLPSSTKGAIDLERYISGIFRNGRQTCMLRNSPYHLLPLGNRIDIVKYHYLSNFFA